MRGQGLLGGMGRGGGGPPGIGLNNNSGRTPFDVTFYEDIFPKVGPATDDALLLEALLTRNTQISPSTDEIQGLQNLVTRVQSSLEALILSPGTFDACQIDEVRQVGSFKQGTILAGHKTADFVVILKTLPTKESVDSLSSKIADDLRQTECVRATVTDRGFELSNVQATVRILITTVPQNMRKLDPEIHLSAKHMNEHWQAIRHSRWFEENAHNSTIKVLIRLLRDMRSRFSGFQPLSTWMLDLLTHYATMNNPTRTPLPINLAFRRTIQLMSGGMYLPGYAGTSTRGHSLTFEDMDVSTATAQTLLRVMAVGIGGIRAVLGLDKKGDFAKSVTVWDGVVISPSEPVFDKAIIEEDSLSEEANNENEAPVP